jgi:hypothetical protein
MARVTTSVHALEVTGAELDIIRKALKVMQDYAEYDDQAECTALTRLREDIS